MGPTWEVLASSGWKKAPELHVMKFLVAAGAIMMPLNSLWEMYLGTRHDLKYMIWPSSFQVTFPSSKWLELMLTKHSQLARWFDFWPWLLWIAVLLGLWSFYILLQATSILQFFVVAFLCAKNGYSHLRSWCCLHSFEQDGLCWCYERLQIRGQDRAGVIQSYRALRGTL